MNVSTSGSSSSLCSLRLIHTTFLIGSTSPNALLSLLLTLHFQFTSRSPQFDDFVFLEGGHSPLKFVKPSLDFEIEVLEGFLNSRRWAFGLFSPVRPDMPRGVVVRE